MRPEEFVALNDQQKIDLFENFKIMKFCELYDLNKYDVLYLMNFADDHQLDHHDVIYKHYIIKSETIAYHATLASSSVRAGHPFPPLDDSTKTESAPSTDSHEVPLSGSDESSQG